MIDFVYSIKNLGIAPLGQDFLTNDQFSDSNFKNKYFLLTIEDFV